MAWKPTIRDFVLLAYCLLSVNDILLIPVWSDTGAGCYVHYNHLFTTSSFIRSVIKPMCLNRHFVEVRLSSFLLPGLYCMELQQMSIVKEYSLSHNMVVIWQSVLI